MLSVKPDRPLEPVIVEVLRHIDTLAAQLALPYFVAGAMSRDILLNKVFGLNAGQVTRDIDFAIAVANWEQFETVKKRLIEGGRFTPDSSATHRLYYAAPGTTSKYPIDLIPFRGMEEPPSTIAWPPNLKVMMNVAGYEEVLANAVYVNVDVGLTVRMASLPGLALLKLFAWVDRGNENSKDAQDFVMILRTYHDAGNKDRLFGQEIWAMEAVEYDIELAGARLVGNDVRSIASPTTLQKVVVLLEDSTMVDRLTIHMARGLTAFDDSVAVARLLLEQFKAGLLRQS